MERLGAQKEAWLRGFLALPFGVPSHDTFRAVLSSPGQQATRPGTHRVDRASPPKPRPARRSWPLTARARGAVSPRERKPPCIWSTPGPWIKDPCMEREQPSEKSNGMTAVPLLFAPARTRRLHRHRRRPQHPEDHCPREIRQADAGYGLALSRATTRSCTGR